MGTRSTTRVYDGGEMVLALYCQFDGYPTGVGVQLAKFIASGKFVNGLSGDEKNKVFNGMGCFAAQLVAHLKEKPGLWYATGNEYQREQFDYEIRGGLDANGRPLPVTLVCEGGYSRFEGPADKFAAWAAVEECRNN